MARKPKDDTKNKQQKVSSSSSEEAKEEVWDLVRVLNDEKKEVCRTEGCRCMAVALWASSIDPTNTWASCETCQLKDFGGWPHGMEPSVAKEKRATSSPTTTIPETSTTEETQEQQEKATPHNKNVAAATATTATTTTNENDISTVPTPTVSNESSSSSNNNDDDKKEIGEADTDTVTATITSSSNTTLTKEQSVPTPPTSETPEAGQQQQQQQQEVWDLKKILPFQKLNKQATIKCSTEECRLPACSVWISNLAPTTKWYSCLDCQERDFGGWPPLGEMPLASMEPQHLQIIASKCSNQKEPVMPVIPTTSTSNSVTSPLLTNKKHSEGNTSFTSATSKNSTNFVTPPPNSLTKATTITTTKQDKDKNKITPATASGTSKSVTNKQPNPKALAIHKKWQEAATRIGGKDARIVVSKPAAKKLIFDLMIDAFKPMNITDIYKALKAIVPSPVLNACLQEMALDKSSDDKNPFVVESDDGEDDDNTSSNKVATTSDPYAGSLLLKVRKSQATNLYYVDYMKLKGLDQTQRNALANDIREATAKHCTLKHTLQQTLDTANKLLSEPTNEDIVGHLETKEATVQELEGQVNDAKGFLVNQRSKEKTKRKIQTNTAHWRKRKRLCMEFLIALEQVRFEFLFC
jgi:hypothetical protein